MIHKNVLLHQTASGYQRTSNLLRVHRTAGDAARTAVADMCTHAWPPPVTKGQSDLSFKWNRQM
jgi:hypothetical protein